MPGSAAWSRPRLMLTELANSHQIDLNSKDIGCLMIVRSGKKSYVNQKFVKFAKSLPIFSVSCRTIRTGRVRLLIVNALDNSCFIMITG